MGTIIILLTALLPIAILVYYIYHKDKKLPEPTGQLVKAFLFGILSVPVSFCISIPLGLIGIYPVEATNILGSISTAFFGAAIPEEIAKFFMLWLLLRKNPYFDEKMDGIVYAVCISLGFAALGVEVLVLNLRSSVGKSFALPKRSEGNYSFSIIKMHINQLQILSFENS